MIGVSLMVREYEIGVINAKKKLTNATIWYLRFAMSWEFKRDRLFAIAFGKSKSLEVLQSIRAKTIFSN